MPTLSKIQALFGGPEKYQELPVLDITTFEKRSCSDYIDNIRKRNMPGPIARGEDQDGRAFLALKLHHKNTFGKEQNSVVTLFQRRAVPDSMWVAGTAYPGVNIMEFFCASGRSFEDVTVQRLSDILNKKDPVYSLIENTAPSASTPKKTEEAKKE